MPDLQRLSVFTETFMSLRGELRSAHQAQRLFVFTGSIPKSGSDLLGELAILLVRQFCRIALDSLRHLYDGIVPRLDALVVVPAVNVFLESSEVSLLTEAIRIEFEIARH